MDERPDDYRSGPPRPGPAGPTDAEALEAYALYAVRRYSTRQIAAELKISQSTAARWVRRGRELEHGEGDGMTGKERRRANRQDADAWLRALVVRIEQDVTAGQLDRDAGYRLTVALYDRYARLHGVDEPRRLAAKAKVRGGGLIGVDPDLQRALAALDPAEVYGADVG